MEDSTSTINKKYLIILLGILAALGPFTIDMYLPAFGQIAKEFDTNENQVAYTLTSYFIGIALGQLLYGPIVDKYGRKKPLLIGLLIYISASLLCAFSINIEMMMAMRFLQAIGGCVGMVATNAIISDVYDPDKRAKAFSSLILVMGVAPLIAPAVGAFWISHFNWKFIFLFLAVFSAVVTSGIYFFLPETSKYTHNNQLKIIGITRDYFEILKNKQFLLYTLAGSFSFAILFAYISSSSFIFLNLYQLEPSTFSIIFAINASGMIAGSTINGYLSNRINYLTLANIASFLLLLITSLIIILIFSNYNFDYWILVIFIFSILFLTGFINPNATAGSLAPFSKNAGAASALGGAIRMGVGAFIAAIIGTFQTDSINTVFFTIWILSITTFILIFFSNKRSQNLSNNI